MPLAVDTNVLARVLAFDGSAQAIAARRCMAENAIFVSDGVLLETEWVWRGDLKLDRPTVVQLMVSLISTEDVHFEDRERLYEVVSAYIDGLDFADAMHLFAARGCEAMVTFDAAFIRRSRKIGDSVPVRKP